MVKSGRMRLPLREVPRLAPANAGGRGRDVPQTIGRAPESATHDRGVTTAGDPFTPPPFNRARGEEVGGRARGSCSRTRSTRKEFDLELHHGQRLAACATGGRDRATGGATAVPRLVQQLDAAGPASG